MSPAGRPSKLTPIRQEVLCSEIQAGQTYAVACAMAGIDYATFRAWILRGERAPHGQFRQFYEAVRKAEAEGERAALARVRAHARIDPTSARWILERRYRTWGPPREDRDGESPAAVAASQSVIVNIVSAVPRVERPAERPAPLSERRGRREESPGERAEPRELPPAEPVEPRPIVDL